MFKITASEDEFVIIFLSPVQVREFFEFRVYDSGVTIINSKSKVNKWQSLKYVWHPYNLFDLIFKKQTKYAKHPDRKSVV